MLQSITRARYLIKRQRASARLSVNRRRVRPRTRAKEIVDAMWLNPNRDYDLHLIDIYFIRFREYVKIGRSSCVAGRLAALQCAHPKPLTLLGSFTGISCDEQFLHHTLVGEPGISRANGEWFTYAPLIDDVLSALS
jgi:hypothetical protein